MGQSWLLGLSARRDEPTGGLVQTKPAPEFARAGLPPYYLFTGAEGMQMPISIVTKPPRAHYRAIGTPRVELKINHESRRCRRRRLDISRSQARARTVD